ncbi:thioredoxin domain-containing protein [Candidatus Methanoperedens nitroreducens]|uniref:Thioredoxin domain-containing protein n=1 Tax=Candidatus Methanoperedens nitratireducens TaxID=1392998 RepID=A0A062V0F0_9EURY|nr:thioredoxin fold domain-containing protein [Candidatus Methanoperedens nitroreducens]KCZ72621.1 thioredoxin domain-containing protein [Candidatus Methanoperedens nitroreducens]MDJ1423447.1 thioredoxin family protein [Candidatus Methanoperedens sp.]
MKKWIKWIFISLALSVLVLGYLYSQSNDPGSGKITLKELEFYTTPEPAFEDAKAQDKLMFVYMRSEYCYWCNKFEEEAFTNQSVIDKLNGNFILVSIDVDTQRKEITNFGVYGTPTGIFLDPNGTEIKRIRGYVENGTFLNTINEIAKLKEA